jgi:hypothetical protein
VVFESDELAPNPMEHRIAVMRSDGTHRRILARCATYPEWAPDGKHIVYTRPNCISTGKPVGIWIMWADGTHRQGLYTPSDFAAGSPRYNPTGSIIILRCRAPDRFGCGPYQWMQMNAFGGNLHRLAISSDLLGVQPAPAGGCFVGGARRSDAHETPNIRTTGLNCPVEAWLTDYHLAQYAGSPSWQPLP